MSWENIVNLNELVFSSEEYTPEYRCESAPLGKPMGAKKLGFHAEILPPGAFSCPYHFHHSEEELFLVLEGSAILRQNNKFRKVSKSDLIFFANAPEGAHQFYNNSDAPFKFLALSTMDSFEVCEYPDSGKIMVGRLRKVFEEKSKVDYLTGEKNPEKFWPAEYIGK